MKIIIDGNVKSTDRSFVVVASGRKISATKEVWALHGITNENQLQGALIDIDTAWATRQNSIMFLNKQAIKSLVTANNIQLDELPALDKSRDESRFSDEDYEPSHSQKIDLSKIYDGIDFYEIKKENQKMDRVDKIVERSLKITKIKYNHGVIKSDDYTYSHMRELAKDSITEFITGSMNELIVEVPKRVEIPSSLKGDKEKILEFLEKRNLLTFSTKTDIMQFRREAMSLASFLDEIDKRIQDKFNGLRKIQEKALKIKHETGYNPLAIAWPFLIGKNDNGTFFHTPICYQYIDIKESLSSYKITKEPRYHINIFPIFKNYTDIKSAVNDIKVSHETLKDVLIEFYKHHIKITNPEISELSDYAKIDDLSPEADSFANGFFKLSNEVLIMVKPQDEPIYSDLKKIRNHAKNFNIPENNTDARWNSVEKESSERNFILDLDNSKAFSVSQAMHESVVIQGPPGTGKSETITSIIGEIIKNFKTSLMVAEKSTAVEVIEKNLRRKNVAMDTFVVNLNTINKDDFVEKYNKQLQLLMSAKYASAPKEIDSINPSEIWVSENEDISNFFENFIEGDYSKKFADFFKGLNFWREIHSVVYPGKEYDYSQLKEFIETAKQNFDFWLTLGDIEKSIEEKEKIIENNLADSAQIKNEIDKLLEIEIEKSKQDYEKISKELEKQAEIVRSNEENNSLIYNNFEQVIRDSSLRQYSVTRNYINSFLTCNNMNECVLKLQAKKPLLMGSFVKKNAEELRKVLDAIEDYKKHFEISNSKFIESQKELEQAKKKEQLIATQIEEFEKHKWECLKHIPQFVSQKNRLNELEEQRFSLETKIKDLRKEMENFDPEIQVTYLLIKDKLEDKKLDNDLIALFNDFEQLETSLETLESSWLSHKDDVANHVKSIRDNVVHHYAYEFRNKYATDLAFKKELDLLTKMIASRLQKRSQTVLDLFHAYHNILKRVFPCIMGSPEIISQILPIDTEQFDYGIFDEASQIRLHKAIPTIHRCKQIIVAGDKKQLGPVDLFNNIIDDESGNFITNDEESDDSDLEHDTLLDFASERYKGVFLGTHYRSKSKQLIEFSNEKFYEGKISIIDTPEAKFDGFDGIIVEEVNGLWTVNRTNEEEAIRAAELADMYLNQNWSVGVITFNDIQSARIEKLIRQRVRDNKLLNLDNFFIKSIKDVQGDERDVIIFSITYGKREASEAYVKSFGQFSKEKINVAITRSKRRMHVLKSIPAHEIVSDNEHKQKFKEWLIYLENLANTSINVDDYHGEPASIFEKDYLEILNSKIPSHWVTLPNYPVEPKENSKKIDIVIFDKNTNRFIIAIELDGAKWHSSPEQRANDYTRQIFLENMGWKFIRVTPSTFYSNRHKQVESDLEKINRMTK